MRFTVLGANISAATIAMQEARKMHAQAHEKLNFTMRYIETAEAALKVAQEEAHRISDAAGPEPFHKIGNRYIAERDVKATIDNAVRAATEELIAKLAALDAPKKGQS